MNKGILIVVFWVVQVSVWAQSDTVAYDKFHLDELMYEWQLTNIKNDNQDNYKVPLDYLCSDKSIVERDNEIRYYYTNENLKRTIDTSGLKNERHLWKHSELYLDPLKKNKDFTPIYFYHSSGNQELYRLPNSFKYYYSKGKVSSEFNDHFHPFYIKKAEVTNKEYREFVFYVRDSIARTILAQKYPEKFYLDSIKKILNREEPYDDMSKIDDELFYEYREVISQMFYQAYSRYYFKRQINPDVLKYLSEDGSTINIHPTTSSWSSSFPFSGARMMGAIYFDHFIYDDFPVVNLSKTQIQAFLEWKEKIVQRTFKKLGYQIELSLPSPIEWEISNVYQAGNYFSLNDQFRLYHLYDKNTTSTLNLKYRGSYYPNNRSPFLTPGRYDYENIDTYIAPFRLYSMSQKKKKPAFKSYVGTGYNLDKPSPTFGNSVFMLGNNVSEWIDYESDSGSLVMGGNWFHDYPLIDHNINQGAYLKAWIPKDSAYPTLGFRYVVRIKHQSPIGNRKIIENAINAHYVKQICRRWELPIKDLENYKEIDTLHFQLAQKDNCFDFCLDGVLRISHFFKINEQKTITGNVNPKAIDGIINSMPFDHYKFKINIQNGLLYFNLGDGHTRYKIIKLNRFEMHIVKL